MWVCQGTDAMILPVAKRKDGYMHQEGNERYFEGIYIRHQAKIFDKVTTNL